MCFFVFAGPHEIFHLHLLELAGAKDEVAGRDFVAKRLADLRHAERQFAPAGVQNIEKVYEDALRGFWTQIDARFGIVFGGRADVRAEHQVERANASPIRFAAIWTSHLATLEKTPPHN